jgi:hypothetical protein
MAQIYPRTHSDDTAFRDGLRTLLYLLYFRFTIPELKKLAVLQRSLSELTLTINVSFSLFSIVSFFL